MYIYIHVYTDGSWSELRFMKKSNIVHIASMHKHIAQLNILPYANQ